MTQTSPVTIATFVIYIGGVFVLAALSHRLLSNKSFVSEYFLGSRGLGSWALAFTFAATSASGGSFTGYPSLIYSYGWVLAFWIASYMVFPICTMGVLGKRLNQIARRSGAITVPDVLRDRFESTSLGLIATCTIIFLTTCNLVAQFKAGALIVEETFNLTTWGYVGGLLIFAVTVVFYTAYGGFRAVVWTDVMQGVMMGIGVVILVPVIVMQAGGLKQASELIKTRPPTAVTSFKAVYEGGNGKFNDLAIMAVAQPRPEGLAYIHPRVPNSALQVQEIDEDGESWIQVSLATDESGEKTISTANEVKLALESAAGLAERIRVEYAFDNDETLQEGEEAISLGATGVIELDPDSPKTRYVFIYGDEAIFGPGRQSDGSPFHPLGMGISFFVMWAITGMGQPGTMVRLMAFRESRTLKRAILTVTVYFALIYLPLIFIFVAARTLLPHIPQEDSDKAMVLVATRVVSELGWEYQILAAIFVAAPFAAVMSTVDSFLLMISSGLVRDIYQRTINPQVSDAVVKWASYGTTALVGALVTLIALEPPDFLQFIIVFTSSGFASAFLFPTMLGLYWKGMTRQGALASMVGGLVIILTLFFPVAMGGTRIHLFGLHPLFWGLSGSLMLAIVVSKWTGPAPQHLVERYFYKPR